MTPAAAIRPIAQVIKGVRAMDGAGVKITRTLGVQDIRVDPFLMLDELNLPANEATAGFPDHPHRGFETCTIMLSGKVEHRDSVGNAGVIGPGGVQWMTAGRGIIHSEMPAITTGDLHGFQLWINLPAKDKMCKPRYQDIKAEEIPTTVLDSAGSSARVMAGTVNDTTGPIKMRNPGMLVDLRVAAGAEVRVPVPSDWNGFAYVYEGSGRLGGQAVDVRHAYVLGEGDEMVASGGKDGVKMLLAAGRPIGEPIVQYGPFVMNSPLEIQQAFADYRSGKFQNPDDDVWHDEEEL